MVKNLFITAVGGDIACAALRCIRGYYSCDNIIGCDIKQYVQGVQYVDEYVLAPEYRKEDIYVDFIKKLCLEKEITHFLPMSEAEIIIADKHRAFFEENKIHLMINNEFILETALSKYKTAHFLKSNDIPAPETFYLTEYQGQLDYPLIIKPDSSCGSKNVYIVKNDNEFEKASAVSENAVVQKYIGSSEEEYTVGIFSDGITTNSIAFKRKLGFGGMSVYVETIEDAAIDRIADKVAEILRLRGSLNIQMRKAEGTYYIFEINPRISSTVGFRHLLGFQDVIWWLNLLDGVGNSLNFKTVGGKIGIKTLGEMIF